MILSDEPGYYENGNFGIRIESLVRVVPAETKFAEKSRSQFLTFTPVTVVPIQVATTSNFVRYPILKTSNLTIRPNLSWRS